ncbi:hypothetical protein HHI36_005030 [Cryptolaemus montrouzieri]|uniref:Uncharacterized protein n=1 Tax=Cryptolaemus montrouzieri TaxID=559131 RepID=A0ABD2NT78_9CUCU
MVLAEKEKEIQSLMPKMNNMSDKLGKQHVIDGQCQTVEIPATNEILLQPKLMEQEHIESLKEEILNHKQSSATNCQESPNVLEKNTEEWKIKKAKRRPGIYGVLQEESKIKAYVPYSHIHLSKVGLENNQQDILEFVRSKIPNISVKCAKLKVKS